MPDAYKARLVPLKDQNTAHSPEELIMVLKWLRKYTEGYQSKKGSKLALGSIFAGLHDLSRYNPFAYTGQHTF